VSIAFSLVIPCYNEVRSIPELVARAEFTARIGGGEVVLVDNGSADGSGALLEELTAPFEDVRVVHLADNAGYGGGILAGLATARARVVGWTHADLQTDPADVLRAIDTLAEPRTFVKGLRHGRPVGDRVFTAGMSAFESALLRAPLRDINAQPTMFDRALMDGWGTPPTDFSLDLFAYERARRTGFRVLRLPVLFAPRRFGASSWNIDFAAKRRFILRTVRYSLALRRAQ
jgi:polyisoprenyl-phosphate glycosyltransferase